MADENSTQTTPFTTWWWISGGFLLLIVIGVGIVLIGNGRSKPAAHPTTTATTTAEPTNRPSRTTATDDEGACTVPDGDQSIPISGPEATWDAQGYILVPSSDVFGPIPGDDPLWPCFAHSPTGALFAAAHFVPGMTAMPEYEEFAHAAAVDDQALENWLALQTPERHEQSPGRVAQYVGFQFQKVEPDAVVVDLAVQQDDVAGSFRASLIWDAEADNWRGDLSTSQFELSQVDPSAFTRWEAGNG